jgi:hypothetical protein
MDCDGLGIEYIGDQETADGGKLECYNDLLTGSTFLWDKSESIYEAIEKCRAKFTAIVPGRDYNAT